MWTEGVSWSTVFPIFRVLLQQQETSEKAFRYVINLKKYDLLIQPQSGPENEHMASSPEWLDFFPASKYTDAMQQNPLAPYVRV